MVKIKTSSLLPGAGSIGNFLRVLIGVGVPNDGTTRLQVKSSGVENIMKGYDSTDATVFSLNKDGEIDVVKRVIINGATDDGSALIVKGIAGKSSIQIFSSAGAAQLDGLDSGIWTLGATLITNIIRGSFFNSNNNSATVFTTGAGKAHLNVFSGMIVGAIESTVINAAALVEHNSTTKAVYGPAMTEIQRNSIGSPPNGSTVFIDDTREYESQFAEGVWQEFAYAAYGELDEYNASGSGTLLTLTLIDTYFQWVSGSAGDLFKTSIVSNEIVVDEAGIYPCTFSVSYTGTANAVIEGTVFVSGVALTKISARRKISGGGDIGDMSGDGILDLAAGAAVSLRFKNAGAAGSTLNIEICDLRICRTRQ